jgi:hypothetical protein
MGCGARLGWARLCARSSGCSEGLHDLSFALTSLDSDAVQGVRAVSGRRGPSLPSDLLDRRRPGHTPTVWARAHFFDGGGLGADEPVVLGQVAWRAEVELAGDQAAYGQAGGLQGHEGDGGLIAVGTEAGEADSLGESTDWFSEVGRQRLLLVSGQLREVFRGERVVTALRPLQGKAGGVSEPLGGGWTGAVSRKKQIRHGPQP